MRSIRNLQWDARRRRRGQHPSRVRMAGVARGILLSACGAVAVLSVLASPSLAADKYRIDPEHVSINFSIQHSKWAKYQGTVRSVIGEILFDKDDVTKSTVTVEIATASVDTLEANRDAELQGGNGFLNASAFPKITFKSTGIERTGDKTGRIRGNLTMAGTTRPVTLDAIFDGEGVSEDGLMRVGFSATGALNTNDFGLTGLRTLNIGPELDFTIEVEATAIDPAAGRPSAPPVGRITVPLRAE
jgi:polyisoprenoid-binding protein YceI